MVITYLVLLVALIISLTWTIGFVSVIFSSRGIRILRSYLYKREIEADILINESTIETFVTDGGAIDIVCDICGGTLYFSDYSKEHIIEESACACGNLRAIQFGSYIQVYKQGILMQNGVDCHHN